MPIDGVGPERVAAMASGALQFEAGLQCGLLGAHTASTDANCGSLSMHSVCRRNVMMALGLLIFVRVAVTAKMQVRYAFCTKLYAFMYQKTHSKCTRALHTAQRDLIRKKILGHRPRLADPLSWATLRFLAWLAPLEFFLDPGTRQAGTFELPEGRCLLRFRPHGCGVLQRGGG